MYRRFTQQARALVVLTAVAAIVLAGCSSSKGSAAPSGNTTSNPSASGAVSSSTTGPISGIGNSAAALDDIDSFKFSMTLVGDDFSSLSAFSGSSASVATFHMSGTVIQKPTKAVDVVMGEFHMIEIEGYDYLDMGFGGFMKVAASTASPDSSLADSLSPATLFAGVMDPSVANGYELVGSETKNGVDCKHYTATQQALDEYSSTLDHPDATWTGDLWVASTGGYPISFNLTAKEGQTIVYQMIFDITNINDPANAVSAPSNVIGA